MERTSVAMATYNGAAYLAEQLESIARQTEPPAELVVCDDGSADATLEILEDFAARARFPVRIHRNPENLGFADNFLRTASLCRESLVAFCDQDDVWLENKLERCRSVLDAPAVQLVIHTSDAVTDGLVRTGETFPVIRRTRQAACAVADWTFPAPGALMVFRRSLLGRIPAAERPRALWSPDSRCFHDQWVHILAAAVGDVTYLSEPLVLYRQHEDNLVGVQAQRLRQRVEKSRGVGSAAYDAAAVHLADCAAIARRLVVTEADPDARRRAASAGAAYERVSRSFVMRSALHAEDAKPGSRVAMLGRMLGRRAYAGRCSGGLGVRALVKDAAVTVLPRARR